MLWIEFNMLIKYTHNSPYEILQFILHMRNKIFLLVSYGTYYNFVRYINTLIPKLYTAIIIGIGPSYHSIDYLLAWASCLQSNLPWSRASSLFPTLIYLSRSSLYPLQDSFLVILVSLPIHLFKLLKCSISYF